MGGLGPSWGSVGRPCLQRRQATWRAEWREARGDRRVEEHREETNVTCNRPEQRLRFGSVPIRADSAASHAAAATTTTAAAVAAAADAAAGSGGVLLLLLAAMHLVVVSSSNLRVARRKRRAEEPNVVESALGEGKGERPVSWEVRPVSQVG